MGYLTFGFTADFSFKIFLFIFLKFFYLNLTFLLCCSSYFLLRIFSYFFHAFYLVFFYVISHFFHAFYLYVFYAFSHFLLAFYLIFLYAFSPIFSMRFILYFLLYVLPYFFLCFSPYFLLCLTSYFLLREFFRDNLLTGLLFYLFVPMGRKATYRPFILGIISRYCWSKDGKIFMHAITGFNNLSVQFQLSSGQHVESSSPQSYFTRNIICTHNRY